MRAVSFWTDSTSHFCWSVQLSQIMSPTSKSGRIKDIHIFSRQGRLRWYFRDLIRPMRFHAVTSIREMCFVPFCIGGEGNTKMFMRFDVFDCIVVHMKLGMCRLIQFSRKSRLYGDRCWVRCKQYAVCTLKNISLFKPLTAYLRCSYYCWVCSRDSALWLTTGSLTEHRQQISLRSKHVFIQGNISVYRYCVSNHLTKCYLAIIHLNLENKPSV